MENYKYAHVGMPYRMIFINSLMFISDGTRNLHLSMTGRLFSACHRSITTYRTPAHLQSVILLETLVTASMAEWLRAWDTLAMMKLWRLEVVSSNPDTIVGRVFSPTRQLVRFSHLNVPFFQNYEFIWNIVPVGKQ